MQAAAPSELQSILDASQAEADAARRTHLWFLESMDRVHRAIQGTDDVEQMMSDVLAAVLAIFDCDRALLAHPCDPETTSYRVPMGFTKPEYPCALDAGVEYPADEDAQDVFRVARASTTPVIFGRGTGAPIPARLTQAFGVQSALVTAIYPKGHSPYLFALHQCGGPRIWTSEEQRLFQEIGRRLADGLTTLLILRDLRQSEARLAEAQRITHATYTDRDVDTNLVTTSDEGLRIFGLPTGERTILLDRLLERIHPDDRDRITRLTCMPYGGGRYDIDFRVMRAPGDVRTVQGRGEVVRDDSGRARRVVGIVQDVTEHKRVEYLMRQVFDSAPDGVAIVGRDHRYQQVNRAYERFWRVPEGPIVGRHVVDVVGPGVYESTSKPNLERCFAGEAIKYTDWLETPFGRLYVEGSYTPLRPSAETVEAALIIVSDLTDHVRAQEALQRAQSDLAHMARVTTLSEIGSSIAHEVNQPLAAIVMGGNACRRWLTADPPNLDEARDAIQRLIADGNRASQVIGRIRQLLRRGDPVTEPLNVNELIRETLALMRTELARAEITVDVSLDATPGCIVGDRVQLQQVLVNLMLNSADAMRVVVDGPRQLTLRSCTTEDGGVDIDVEDTGVGLGAADADRIFDAFFSTKPNGLGMGLSISRSIIDAHNGRLWATPNDGRGATFHVRLPPPV